MAKKRKQLLTLKKVLEKEIQDAQLSAVKVRYESNKINRETSDSWSAGGDRYHASSQADIVEKRLEDMELCLGEVEKACKDDIPKKVTKTCYVELEIKGGVKHNMFVLINTATIPTEAKIVSAISPLGKAIVGKKEGATIKYKPGGNNVVIKGVVSLIE